MANPQKENGFTGISNEILEQICKLKLNGTQYKIIIIVWRFTYGYSRKEHELSESFLANATNTHKIQLSRELNKLIEYNILKVTREATFTKPRRLMFNKNYNEWIDKQLVNSLTPNEINNTTASENTNTTVSESTNQERNNKIKIKKATPRSQKHKYGEYQHVQLTDKEKERLISEYGEDIFNKCIKKLDEYIEIKKPKYNNHNLVIRKWVIKAVLEDDSKSPSSYGTEKIFSPAKEEPVEEPIDLWSD